MARKGLKKKLEDIPIPFSDVKNIVEELRFEDEATGARCRGWLVLQAKKFLQANILFPGCESDCRISIRALTGEFHIPVLCFTSLCQRPVLVFHFSL